MSCDKRQKINGFPFKRIQKNKNIVVQLRALRCTAQWLKISLIIPNIKIKNSGDVNQSALE